MYFHFGFVYASTDMKINKQNLVYSAVSLISELGGSFGIFLGLSFLTLFDCLTYLYERFYTFDCLTYLYERFYTLYDRNK